MMQAADETPRAPSGLLWSTLFRLSVALAGAATMVVELAAVRLLAPWFGTSAGVWTNVIGVILAGLALGYLFGARLAALRSPAASLALALACSSCCVVFLPYVVGPVARWFLPEGVALHEAAGLVAWGSLAVTGIVFLPAACALGCVGPLAVEVLQVRTHGHAGTAGGHVLAASTLGSLAGTFATTHLLVPELGLARTFGLCGLALFLVALFFVFEARSQASRLAAVAALGPLLVLLPAAFGKLSLDDSALGPALPEGVTLLAQAESAYQSVRVVEELRAGEPFRQLQVNEGFDSFQSVWRPTPGFFGTGYYYDLFALPTWWQPGRESWNVLVLGLGAGSAVRVLEGAASKPARERLTVVGVEIDPVVVQLAREHLDLTPPTDSRVRVGSGLDGRVALRIGLAQQPQDWLDYVILDAYAHQVEIPAHLASLEFFDEVFERLAPGGWLGVNVGGFGFDDPVVAALAATIARASARASAPDSARAAGGQVLALRVPQSRNYVLFARRGEPLPAPPWSLEAALSSTAPGTAEQAAEADLFHAVRALCAQLEFAGAARLLDDTGTILTDDRSPLDRLQARSLAAAAQARRAER